MRKRYSKTPFWQWYNILCGEKKFHLETVLRNRLVRCKDGRARKGFYDGIVTHVIDWLPEKVIIRLKLEDGRYIWKEGSTIWYTLD